MLPFCGYNMADYFGHWLDVGATASAGALPRIYYVNWFRKGTNGRFLWPGYGENSRVLRWVFERCEGKAQAAGTPIGLVPTSLDTLGLDVDLEALLEVDRDQWRAEVKSIQEHYAVFGDRLPPLLDNELNDLRRRLS